MAAIVNTGEMVTVYNLRPAKLPVYSVQQRDKTISDLQSTYNGFDLAMTARLTVGARSSAAGPSRKTCRSSAPTTTTPTASTSPIATPGRNVSAGSRFCDQGAFDMPFRHEFKMAGTYPLRWGVDVGAVLQSYAGSERIITVGACGGTLSGRTNQDGDDYAERAGLPGLSALQPARLQRQEDVPGRTERRTPGRWTGSISSMETRCSHGTARSGNRSARFRRSCRDDWFVSPSR